MKAKVIATGEIVEVVIHTITFDKVIWKEVSGIRIFDPMDIVILPDDYKIVKEIDWEQRRFELVKAAMQGMSTLRVWNDENDLADWSLKIADAVIAKLKEE